MMPTLAPVDSPLLLPSSGAGVELGEPAAVCPALVVATVPVDVVLLDVLLAVPVELEELAELETLDSSAIHSFLETLSGVSESEQCWLMTS